MTAAKRGRWRILGLTLLALGGGAGSSPAAAGEAAFETLESLIGEWRGTQKWSGAIQGEPGPVVATYELTGNGSAVVESLGDGSDLWMTTVYYVDGDGLVANHYCTHNQPRLRQSELDPSEGQLSFELESVANLDRPDEGHVHAIELRPAGRERLLLVFHYRQGPRRSTWSVEVTRADRAARSRAGSVGR